ncbi:hypothetical protein JTB14_016677 [Gonioctena quinquepunctata]|nr:hypothetical protein JTB14_016677 [Gonioctena quinquepunctata]
MPCYIELKKIKFKDPDLGLKVILMIHFLLTTLGAMGSFCPIVYLFYNICLMVPMVRSIYGKRHEDSLKMAIMFNMTSIFLDAFYIVLALDGGRVFREYTSAVLVLLHLIFRPFSILFLMKQEDKRKNALIEGESKDERLDNIKSTQTVLENVHFDFPTLQKNRIIIT